MPNPLNLKTATFTRINSKGYAEPQKMSVEWQHADFNFMSANVRFQSWKDDEAREKGASPVSHQLNIPLDLMDEDIAQAIAVVSGLIWEKALTTQFIETYEEDAESGKLTPVKKSLTEIGAVIEDVEME